MPNNPTPTSLESLFAPKKEVKSGILESLFNKPLSQGSDISNIYNPTSKNYEEFGEFDQFMTPEADQEAIRSTYQGTGYELANGLGRAALKVVPSIIGNVASIVDLEDYLNQDKEVGNAVTRYMEELKGGIDKTMPIYGEHDLDALDMGKSEWWTSNFSGLAESAAAFALTGAGLGAGVKGLGFLSKIAGASSTVQKAIQAGGGVATAVALNQAEAITSAMSVYDNAFKYQTETLHKSEEEAKQIAADAAAYTVNINRLNLPLNITSTLAFLRTSPMTRQAIQQAGLKSAGMKIAEESAQEFGEEIINKVAEDEGNRYGKIGKEYNYNLNNTISDIFSAEGLEAGLLGALGGAAQTGLSEGLDRVTGRSKEQNELYDKQQASLKQLDLMAGGQSLKTVVNNIATQASLINDINDAQASGDELKVESLKNSLLINQAVNSFDAGTTDKLEELYTTISKTPEQEGEAKYGKGFKENATKAISQIKEWEHSWNKSMQTTPDDVNKKELFINKLQQQSLNDRINDLKQTGLKLNTEIQNIRENTPNAPELPQELELKTVVDSIGSLQKQLTFVQEQSKSIIYPETRPKQKFIVSPAASAPINQAAQQVASQQVSKPVVNQPVVPTPAPVQPVSPVQPAGSTTTQYGSGSVTSSGSPVQNTPPVTPTPQVTPESTTQKPTAKEQLAKRTTRMKELLSEGKTITEAGNIAAEEFPLDPLDSVLDSFEPGNTTGNLEKLQSEIDKLNNQADKLYSQETKLVLNAANMFIKEKLSQKDKGPLTAEDVETNLPSVTENQPHLVERIVGMVNAGMGLVVTPSKASVANTQTIEPVVSTKEIEEESKEKLFESTGFKITTGHTAATKIVATDSNNNPRYENGRIKFEDNEHTPAYVKMHTNQVQIGEDWEIVLNNEAEELDDLELELIYTNPTTGEKESRGFVHKEAYITEENTTLVGEELQKEKERIRAIRQFYKDKGTGKKVRVTNVTLAKPEFNERAEVASLDGITPDMMKKVVVRGDSKFITVDGATFNGSVEGDGELISGAIYFLAPQATHVNNGITHLPILLTKKTFNTHGKENKTLNEIRENIKKELLGVLNGIKLPTNSFTDQFIFIDNSDKPSDEYRIVIKGNTIEYAGGQVAKTEKDLDDLLINVKFNFNSKGDQAYRDQVQKAGLLVSNLATLESGGTKLYAFQPTYIFEEISIANPATITSETKIEETPPIVEKEIVVEEDGQVQESNLPEIQRELEKEGIILDWEVNEGLDSLEVNPEVENSNVISLVEDASVVDSLAFQVIQDLRLNPEAKTTVDSLKAKFERAIGILEKVAGSEANVRKAQEHIAVFKDVLDRFDTLKVKAEEKLQKMNFGKNKQGFYEDMLDQQDSPSQYQDGSAYMENRLDSMPAIIRKLMSFIADYTAKGEIKRNVVGMPTFVPLDMIETIVSEILTPEVYVNSKDSLNKMIDLLGQSQNPAVKELHQILSTTKNLQLKQQFYKVFSVERDKPESFVFSDEGDDVKLRKTASDNTSGEAVIRKEWVEAMKANSNLVNEKGELNKDFVKSLANRLRAVTTDKNNFSKNAGNKELKKAESLTISTSALFEVVRILKDLGLDVNIQTIYSWLVGDKNYKGKRDDRDHITLQLGKYFFKILENSKTLDGFIDETSSQLTSLAHHSGITGTRMIGGSYRIDGDTYSVHANSKPMTEKLDWIKSKWEELKEHKVYKYLYSRLNEMKVITDRGFRKNKKGARPKMMKDSNEEEFELMRILMFQQFGQLKTETHSDKTTNFTVTGSTRNDLQILSIQDDGVYGISEQVVRSLYNYFNMEVAKIQTYKTRMANSDLLKLNGVDSTEDTKGAGEYFMYNEQLNAEILAESTDKNDKKILDALYDKNKNGVYRLKDTIALSPEVTALIRNKIKDRFRAIVKETRDTWKQFGVYETKNGKVSGIKFMSNEYKNRLLSQYTHVKDSADRLTLVMQHAYTDYAFNYVQSLLETNFILGDPAQQSKIIVSQKPLTAAQVLKGIEDTFVHVSKRNARLLAQGGRGAWRKTNYKTQIFNDLDTDSRNVEQYLEEIQKAYKGDRNNESMTNAQEFTTVLEHLEDRLENGEIDFKEFEAGMLMFDPEHYQELLKDLSFKEHYPQASMRKIEIDERNRITSMGILQPRKPVQVYSKLEGGLIQEYYIKTSSVPLVPALVENSPFKKVLEMMKKNDVQRMTFNSAVKIGQSGVQNLFNEDGSVNEEGFSSPVELNRSGYHIQLNVPYDEDKHAIRQGSQVLKLLFVDLPEFVTIDGKQVENELRPGVTVKSLKKQYRDLQIKMVKEGKESLLKEVLEEADISVEDGKYVIRNATKLSKILKEAGKDRDFIENSLKMLNVDKDGNMLFPLSFNPNADKIQPLLNALITNTVMRQKIEGKSYVQVSEVMLYDKRSVKEVEDLTEAQRGGIVYTKSEYKGLKKLGYVVKGKDGEQTQMAQVYAPFFFKDQDGKKIPMSKFVVDGVLDLTRIPEDLLVINGFRIPTEGAKSMMMFEVVGFLPEAMGDTLIVPSEIAVQMGSDYDVDKLYTYNYEVDLNSIAEGDVNKAVLSKRKESNSNELIDIHKEVLLSAQMFDRLTTPQGFDGLLQAAEEVESLLAGKGAGDKKQWLGMYDPNYQRRVFFDNLAGKNGTAMAANANTFHALAQDADLYIKGIGFLFKDETGQYYDDSNVEENRVNEYKASSYPEGKKDDKNVWRLGKVTSFGGKSISNSISEWLAASVDNAKAKLLGRAGINDHNLAVGLTLVQAGFDNPLILSFINQPILKDYYLAMDGAKSMFNDKFEQDKVNKAIQDVVDKYVKKSGFETLGLEGYSLSEYQDMLGGSPDKLSQEQNIKQVIILKTFLHYKGISDGIRSVQSSFVLDSKGLPKNHLEVIEIIGKQNLAPQGSVGNVRNLENTVISPYINIPKFAEKLFSKIYYYGKPAYQTILSEVKEALGKVELMTDELNDIYNGIYSFVYSLPEIQNRIADGRNVEQYKKDLLNLAPTIERMKRLHPNNNFLRRIRVVDGVPIMENSFSTSDALEHQTTLSWLDMMKSNQQDAELKQLGLDLAAFTMFYNNSLFGVSNFMKYVPFEYYQSIGLSKTLQDLGDKLDNETYLKEFTKQYFQHSPELAKSLSIGFDGLQRVIKKVGKKEITTDVYVKIGDDSISITSDFGSETSPRKFFPFIKNYNRTTEKYDLYELVDENSELLHYKLISTLGDNAKTVSEYNFTDSNQVSNLDSNLERFQESDAVLPEVKVEVPKVVPTKSTVKDSVLTKNGQLITDPKALLSNIQLQGSEYYRALAKHISDNLGTVTIVYDTLPDGKPANYFNGTVTLDAKQLGGKDIDNIQRIVLHEFDHALTASKLKDPGFQQTDEYVELKDMYQVYRDVLEKDGKLEEADKFWEIYKAGGKNFTESMKASHYIYYAAGSLDEFVTGVRSNPQVQAYMAGKLGVGKTKSVVNRIIQILKDALGIQKNSLLEDAYDAILKVVEYNKPVNNNSSITEISKPIKATKKTEYTWFNSSLGRNVTKTGYRLTIPEFPNVELYITNQVSNHDSKEGSSELNTTQKAWNIEVNTKEKGSVTIPTGWVETLQDVIETFTKDINEKHSKTEQGRKVLATIGINFGKPVVETVENNTEVLNTFENDESTLEIELSSNVAKFMNSLSKEARETFREMRAGGTVKTECK